MFKLNNPEVKFRGKKNEKTVGRGEEKIGSLRKSQETVSFMPSDQWPEGVHLASVNVEVVVCKEGCGGLN